MYEIILGRTKEDKEKFGTAGTVFLGKQYVKMGRTTSLANEVYLDVVRSHVVFVCGKRGCLTEDSLVFTDSGYKKIKDFNSKKDKIYSFNLNGNEFEWESAELLSYPLNDEEMYTIELSDGQTLTLTGEHPLLVYSGGVVWKAASDLTKKDKVVGVYHLPDVSNNSESVRIARLLGFILADGTMQKRTGTFKDGRGYLYKGTKARVRIFNAEHTILEQAKEDLEKEFKIKAKKYERQKYNSWVIETKHQKVFNKFIKLGIPSGNKSRIIRVPDIVFKSSNKFKAEFLKSLFSCDGFVAKNGIRIMYYSNSKNFITDLQLLFAHFHIQSKMRVKKTTCNNKKFTSYLLDITDYTSLKTFQKKIGFFNEEKNSRLKKRNFWRMKRRKSTIYLNDKLFCLNILDIKKTNGISRVYDLTVPKNSSFIANGVVSHNSGKSYSMGVIAEGIADLPNEVRDNIGVVILDTMGIYWTMKYANQQDIDILDEWKLKGKSLDVRIFTPIGYYEKYREKGIPTDFPFSIRPADLDAGDWCTIFEISLTEPIGVLIERIISRMKEAKDNFSVDDIIREIQKDEKTAADIKNAAENRFVNSKTWGLFSKEGTPLKDIVRAGQISVLDVSAYVTIPGARGARALVIGLVAQKMFIERMIARKEEEYDEVHSAVHLLDAKKKKSKVPLVWLVIDEAHEFLPRHGKTVATDALVTILREGRQPGISLILASQQPGKIHTDVMTQSDIVISHVITAKIDTEALSLLTQTYMREGLDQSLSVLPKVSGAAVVLDDSNERIFPMKVRPRFTWHGGGSPSALPEKEKELFRL